MKKIMYLTLVGAMVAFAGAANAGHDGEWLNKKNTKIEKEYNETIKEINEAKVSNDTKDFFKKQAQERRDFAMKSAKEKNKFYMDQHDAQQKLNKVELDASDDIIDELKDIR